MPQARLPHQPTIRHLLSSEALSEAQVICREDLLDRPVMQVITSVGGLVKPGSLVVGRSDVLASQAPAFFSDLSALFVIKTENLLNEPYLSQTASNHAQATQVAPFVVDLEIERLKAICIKQGLPLILLPGLEDPSQVSEDVRASFLVELRRATCRLHAYLVSIVLSEGLPALLAELFTWINRPLAIETADFKMLAAKNMGSTPASQQKAILKRLSEDASRQLRLPGDHGFDSYPADPLKIGRRLVLPIVFDQMVVGYLSAMTKLGDDSEAISEYMVPAALACMVDFSQRGKEVSSFTATKQSLLKDLLLGHGLSAADQERLERHFGFDLCDGLLAFAVQVVPNEQLIARQIVWPDEPYISTEIEGTHVFVVPYHRKTGKTWQQEAENLLKAIKKKSGDVKVQIGAGRLTTSIIDLPDSYREARQALIIGTMVHGDNEFAIGYGDLGVKRLIYLLFDHPELTRFYEETLAPLESYDAEWESELVTTLAVYLKQGANLNSAARALFIHRHTLRYRLEQIAEILKVDIDSQEVLLNLQIAFLIKEMKGKS